MNRLTITVALIMMLMIQIGCAIEMTDAGSSVRVVDSTNADFINECEFIKAITVRKMQGNGGSLDVMNAKTEIRNSAPDHGANVVIYTDEQAGGLFGRYATADLYRCH